MRLFGSLKETPLYREMTPRLFMLFMFISVCITDNFLLLGPLLTGDQIGAVNFGIDNGWWATVLTVDDFKEEYGVWSETKQAFYFPSSWLSAGSGTANAGMAVGAMLAGPIVERLGRRLSVIVIVVIGLVGMVIQNAVPNYWGVMAGRTINSVSMVRASPDMLHVLRLNHSAGH